MNANSKPYINYVICFVLGVLFSYVYISCRPNAELESIRKQFADSQNQCAELERQIAASERRIRDIQDGIDKGKAGIESAEKSIGIVQDRLRDSEQIIEECQRIVRQLRIQREEKGTKD